jgi:hypothetical protein
MGGLLHGELTKCPSTSFTAPSIPTHLAQFPTIGGVVVPFVTLQHRNGKAARQARVSPRGMPKALLTLIRESTCWFPGDSRKSG